MSKDHTNRNIRWSKEKLSVEVWLFYSVHVRHDNLSLSSCQPNHGKVFHQLAADGTSPNLKELLSQAWLKCLMHILI